MTAVEDEVHVTGWDTVLKVDIRVNSDSDEKALSVLQHVRGAVEDAEADLNLEELPEDA